jgi:hypothetical protein
VIATDLLAFVRANLKAGYEVLAIDPEPGGADVRQFVASVAPIVRDSAAAHAFCRDEDALRLSFEGGEGEYKFRSR